MEFQTRSEDNGIRNFPTFEEALKHSRHDPSVWKISFTITETNERIRLFYNGISWIYAPIPNE